MIKAVIHFKNNNGYSVIYEDKKRKYTRSFCERKVPKTAIDFILKENVKSFENDFSVMYQMED